MPYNESTGRPKTRSKAFSRKNLIAWLEQMPSWCSYDFCDADRCLLAQWVRYVDPHATTIYGDGNASGYAYMVGREVVDLARFKNIARGPDETFGAALMRARAALTNGRPETRRLFECETCKGHGEVIED